MECTDLTQVVDMLFKIAFGQVLHAVVIYVGFVTVALIVANSIKSK